MRWLAAFRPLLSLFGLRLPADLADRSRNLSRAIEEFSSLPDRFNHILGQRGWIAYAGLNVDTLGTAVQLGEAGRIADAEAFLVSRLDDHALDRGIRFMRVHKAFDARERLTRLALEDYLAGRYHACVPVLLMIIDGFVNDVSRRRGFFAKDIELRAWDTIAAHDRGLQTLARLWQQTRKKTTTERIELPFRHGILHGRDLGYDNQLVAAKLWAGLFALREWAIAVRDNKTNAAPPAKEPSLSELFASRRLILEESRRLDAWRPRDAETLARIPAFGPPDAYASGTPERAAAEALHYWQQRNWGLLATLARSPHDEITAAAAGRRAQGLRRALADTRLQSFEILKINETAPALATVVVAISRLIDGKEQRLELTLRLVHSQPDGTPSLSGSAGSSWTIGNLMHGL